jgi:hypothetical protein
MRIFSLLLLLVCSCGYHYSSSEHPPPIGAECQNTCDAQREFCVHLSSRIDSSKSRESCMADWTACTDMCFGFDK